MYQKVEVDIYGNASGAVPAQIKAGGVPARIKAEGVPAQIETTATTQARVLVVEDDVTAMAAIKLLLSRCKCEVDVAQSGVQGVEKATKNAYDLIFMDIGLPDMGGDKVAESIRNLPDTQKSQVPIVALTSHASDAERRQQCLSAGIQKVLVKPMLLPLLESTLQQYVFASNKVKAIVGDKAVKATPSEGAPTIIDWEGSVAKLRDSLGSSPRELLMVLSEDLKTTQPKLARLYANRETKLLREELHRIGGGVCYLKLPQLEQSLANFGKAIRTESQDLSQSKQAFEQLQQAITNFLCAWDIIFYRDL